MMTLKGLTIDMVTLREDAAGKFWLDVQTIEEGELNFAFSSAAEVIQALRDNNVTIDEVETSVISWNPIYLVDVTGDDEFNLAWYDEEEAAIRDARRTWGKTSATDKRSGMRLELRRYAHNIETAEPVNFDYDLIEWGYIIRDREAGNEIDSFASLPEACDTLTEYVEQDADGETIPENPYDRVDFYDDLIEFYEIYDTETEKPVRVHWDINDNCVVFC